MDGTENKHNFWDTAGTDGLASRFKLGKDSTGSGKARKPGLGMGMKACG